jgi:hypothetical protein
MERSIGSARAEVQRAFERAHRLADTAPPQRFCDFDRELWTAVLALGRAFVSLFLAHQAARARPVDYLHAGQRFVLKGERVSELGTRFGKVSFLRPLGRRRDAAGRGVADLPVDRELGLCSGFSVGLVMAVTRLCAQLAFGQARGTFRYFHEWAPSSRAVLRMVDSVGDMARPFLEDLPAPRGDGDVLVIEVDARGAPMIGPGEHQLRKTPRKKPRGSTRRHHRRQLKRARVKPRRKSGQKSKNAKGAFVAVLYTLRRTANGREGPINKRLIATFESHEALFVWLQREAIKRGYGIKPCLFLADGSEHIWRLQQQYLPLAEVCIDWFHVIEKMWDAGQAFHRAGTRGLRLWVGNIKKLLRAGRVRTVIRELTAALRATPKTGPGNKGKRKRLADAIRYLTEHRQRMRYDSLRARDLVIGTGAAEGAVRNLIELRLDGPGMRWGRDRSERVLHLRCILLSGLWDDFAAHVARAPALKLRASPMPARPYEAAPRKEAA